MTTLRKFWSAILAAGTLSVFGCGTIHQTYEGPKKAAHEVAVLKTNVGELAVDTVWIGKVDDKDLVLAYSEVEVLPGQRSLQVNLKGVLFFLQARKTVSFEAKAGRTYRVKGMISLPDSYAWIEDESTGEIVAGEKP